MIDVYLFKGKHPLYETMLTHPPDGVRYMPTRTDGGSEGYTLYNPRHSFLRSSVNKLYAIVDEPRVVPILTRYDLVHSCRGFFVAGPNRYVVDLEHISSFCGMRHSRMDSPRLRRNIERRLLSDKCARILPHCQMAEKTIAMVTDRAEVERKTTVVYPAVQTHTESPLRSNAGTPNILFFGEYFWKGGREFIKACIRLSSKIDFRVKYFSLRVHPPKDVIEAAKAKLQIDYVEGPVTRQYLLDTVYPTTDIFVMPTSIDTFGYAFLEAMSYGIPCIGTRHFAVPEIVEDGVTGLLVTPPHTCFDETGRRRRVLSVESADSERTVVELTKSIEELVNSDNLRSRMGRDALKRVSEGKFSIGRRNGQLREVYESSIRF